MRVFVTRDFLFRERNVVAGDSIEMDERDARKFAAYGFVSLYETKVEPAPVEKKTAEPSAASQPAPVSRKKTAKKRSKRSTAS